MGKEGKEAQVGGVAWRRVQAGEDPVRGSGEERDCHHAHHTLLAGELKADPTHGLQRGRKTSTHLFRPKCHLPSVASPV